jgi:hypothetical protein
MKNIVHYFFICVVLAAVSTLNVGCKELKTIVIKPDSKRFVYWHTKHNEADWACGTACFPTHGTSCNPGLTADDSTIVGYSHSHDGGTWPCPCWWYVNCAYRGYVGFNVSQLKQTGIVSATLKWDPITQRGVGGTATNVGNCIAKVYVATEAWQKERTVAGEEIPWVFTGEADPKPGDLNVSQTVRGWLNGTQANYGFFFVGPNEDVNEKNNNRCLTTMNNLRLEAIISVDK